MSRRTLVFEILHAALMSLWIGAAILAGAAAALTFPTVKQLQPSLPTYARYDGEHWRIAGGKVMVPIFGFAGWMQVACVTLACVAFFVARWPHHGVTGKRVTAVRALFLVLFVWGTGYQAAVLRVRMTNNLYEEWSAAESGDNAAAQKARSAFDADHGRSNAALGGSVVLGLLCVGLAAAACRPPREAAT